MIVFPNGKINLGLSVVNKRADGYHNIESILYPVPICDALEFQTSSSFTMEIIGIQIPGNVEDNILYKTWKLLRDEHQIPPIDIKLLKGIPVGSGLGGGSADAVFLLKSLNTHFELGLNMEKLFNYASSLGSDCPFFLKNSASIIKGRGEIVQPINFSLKGMHLVVVFADIHISTKEAFCSIEPEGQTNRVEGIINKPIENWCKKLVNDFEKTALQNHPIIQTIKDKLISKGAAYVSLTGSGSAIYALFDQQINMKKYFPDYFVWNGILN